MSDVWVSVTAESALYVDRGRDVILCDRLPHPVELVLRLTPENANNLRAELAADVVSVGPTASSTAEAVPTAEADAESRK